jgi:putative oxidoreductase
MSVVQIEAAPRWRRIGLWVVKALLAAVFAGAGAAKLIGVPMMVETFATIGFGQWFRYLTGALEVLGAIALLVPAIAGLASLMLAAVMVGATFAHLTVVPGPALPALVLLALSLLVAWSHRGTIEAAARSVLLGRD